MSVGLPRLAAMKKRIGFALFARKFVRGGRLSIMYQLTQWPSLYQQWEEYLEHSWQSQTFEEL